MSIREQITEFVTSAGFKIYSLQGHRVGLPAESYVTVAADYSPIDGPSFLAVFADRVVRYGLRTPYNHNQWQSLERRDYASPEELRATLADMVREPKGCWA